MDRGRRGEKELLLWNLYCVRMTVLGAMTHIILPHSNFKGECYFHFTGKETKARRK